MRKMTFIFGYWPARRRSFRRKLFVFLLFGFFILGLSVIPDLLDGDKIGDAFEEITVFLPKVEDYLENPELSDNLLKSILRQGLPVMSSQKAQYISTDNLAQSILAAVTTVNLRDPKALLNSQFSYIEEIDMEAEEVAALPIPYNEPATEEETRGGEGSQPALEDKEVGQDAGDENLPGNEEAGEQGASDTKPAGDNPLVGLYNTHNAENYSGEGAATKVEGKNAGVVRVAEVIETTLRDTYGIAAARSTQIHDYPNWNLSYTKSKETAKSLLSKNPSIRILVDIHRDAGIKEKRTVMINGTKAAQILFIVGSSQRLEHPNWKQNKEFAEKLHAKAQELYPGLSRGVRVQTGRYNQHLHPHSVLVEVGNVKNSLKEAEYTGKLMAHIFSEVLKDLSAKKL